MITMNINIILVAQPGQEAQGLSPQLYVIWKIEYICDYISLQLIINDMQHTFPFYKCPFILSFNGPISIIPSLRESYHPGAPPHHSGGSNHPGAPPPSLRGSYHPGAPPHHSGVQIIQGLSPPWISPHNSQASIQQPVIFTVLQTTVNMTYTVTSFLT